jgi:hypothetical protein
MFISGREKTELFSWARKISEQLGSLSNNIGNANKRFIEHIKHGDEKYDNLDGRVKSCEKTTNEIKTLTKIVAVIYLVAVAVTGLYLQYYSNKTNNNIPVNNERKLLNSHGRY